jgi:hypothetical protein
MKKLLTIIAFLSVTTAPALAQSYTPEFGTANAGLTVPNQYGEAAYAQMPYTGESRRNEYADPRAVRKMSPSYQSESTEGTYRR